MKLTPTVTNILRFLQTLDSDANPDNGIQLSSTVIGNSSGQVVNFSQSTGNFESNVSSIIDFLLGSSRPMVPASQAQQHLRDTLNSLTGGGSSIASGDFGVLTMSGADTAAIGTSFQTINAAFVSNSSSYAVSWATDQATSILTISMLNDQPFSIALLNISTINNMEYHYFLNCTQTQACTNLNANPSNKTATFNNLSIPVNSLTSNNAATSAIVLNGTLSWQ